MEVAIGEAAVTMAIEKAVTLFNKEFARLSGVKEKIHGLTQNLELVNGYLRHAEASNLTTERDDVRRWLGQLENIAYDIEDLLDECGAEATLRPGGSAKLRRWRRSRLHDGLCLVSDCFLSCCISNPTSVSFRRVIAKKFESVEQRLEKTIKMGLSFGLVNLSGPSQLHQSRTRSSRETGPFREEGSLFVGREEKIKEIKVKLWASVDRDDDSSNNGSSSVSRGNSCEAKISVVAIVGFGGMGKTTLAQAIFDDKEVEARFTMRKWVFVGEDFDTKRLIRDIIGDEGTGNNMTSLSGLQARLKERVCEHRFLIIWDDVWNNTPTDWHDLWVPLSDAREGSVIVVTTRKLDVAKTMGPHVSIHELDRLSDDHCWRIFERRAFQGVKFERDHHRLEGIGRKIVEKLKGVPLAASMIGDFLGAHLHDVRKWEWVLNSTEWPLTAEGSIVDKVIDLSYRHLPPHLRLCFAYCGIFPKDFRFDRKDLVLMWMAQSYVKHEKGRELEDTGDDYFEDLYRSSFFQFINEEYVMHDIIHDYAQKAFKSGKRVSENDRIENCMASAGDLEEQVRHLSFSCDSLQATEVEKLRKFHKLRTLHLICWGETIDLDFLAELKYLRVLKLEVLEISEFPKSIKSLKLLKYLDIGKTGIHCMPDDLVSGTLCNLQTLRLGYFCSVGEGVSKLVNLRHLHGDPFLISLIPGLGKLTSLQELVVFKVARSDGRKIVELKGLNCLRGCLRIDRIENVESKGEAEVACLKDKVHLEGLHLSWSDFPPRPAGYGTLETEVLEALRPPPNLKELALYGTCGIHLPTWMMEPSLPLSNLVSLSLLYCTGWEHLPPLGRLPYLKLLTIWSASSVKKVGPGFLGINNNYSILDGNQCHHQQAGEVFRSLETLKFVSMPEWEVWDAAGILEEETRTPDQGCGQVVAFFPSLRTLALKFCPMLELPVEIMLRLTALRDLTITGCRSLASSSLDEDACTSGCQTWPLECFVTDNRSLLQWLLQHSQMTKRFPFLRDLTIENCDELISFTDVEEDGLKHLISLEQLNIFNCQNLRYLPSSLHTLPSLQLFRLWDCPEIQCLPDGGLPPSLLDFGIARCPLLAERCGEGGADYLKIQGIKDFYVH